jgi:hypothetical protein
MASKGLLPLNNEQKNVIDELKNNFPEDSIPIKTINICLQHFPCHTMESKEEVIGFMERGGNAIYNFLLHNLLEVSNNLCDEGKENLKVISFVTLLNRTIDKCDNMGYRFVWIWRSDLSIISAGVTWHSTEHSCQVDGIQHTPSYDSNDGFGCDSGFMSCETLKMKDIDGVGGKQLPASVDACSVIKTSPNEFSSDVKSYHVSDSITLKQSPWIWYSDPPLYHYQVFKGDIVIDNIGSLMWDLKDVYTVYVKPKLSDYNKN